MLIDGQKQLELHQCVPDTQKKCQTFTLTFRRHYRWQYGISVP